MSEKHCNTAHSKAINICPESAYVINKKRLCFLILLFLFSLFLSGCQKSSDYLQLKERQLKGGPGMIRKPAAAGSYYPAGKEDLASQINTFLSVAKEKKTTKELKILIVPHAGYDYSGVVAGWGFRQLEGMDYKRVILIGNSHHFMFDKIAVCNEGAWQTPLGEVEIDREFADKLIAESPALKAEINFHVPEQILEVEVPFLQTVLKDFKIVPILLSQSSEKQLNELAEVISNNFDEDTLLVISTDLSHYPDYETANEVDKKTISSILAGDWRDFSNFTKEVMQKDYQGLETPACSADAVKTAMMIAQHLGIDEIKLFNYQNSGDVTGDFSRVVGYASIGFFGKISKVPSFASPQQSKDKAKSLLNSDQQKALLKIARETLKSYLKDKKIPEIKTDDEGLNQKFGVFVTLKKDDFLRGCIGEFEPKEPLCKLVQKKAIDAAVNDPRFDSLKSNELPEIEIEISILSPQQKIDDWKKIELGKHGVFIHKGSKGGTFLPQVASESNWSLEEFLSHLCSDKAGLPPNCYKDPDTNIYTYTAEVFGEK